MIFNSPPQFTAAPAHDEVIVAELVGFGGHRIEVLAHCFAYR
jgi:hypothetical protein